jgi:hypothetical protein
MSGDQGGYDAAHTAMGSVASAHTLSSKYNYGNREDDEEDEQQFILEHIVTPVSILVPKMTHVFTLCVIAKGNLFVVRLRMRPESNV